MKHGHRMVEFKEVAGKSIRSFRFTNDEDFRAVAIVSQTAPAEFPNGTRPAGKGGTAHLARRKHHQREAAATCSHGST
jgi:hypothetical protein